MTNGEVASIGRLAHVDETSESTLGSPPIGSTMCYLVHMAAPEPINQRDLRMRSREIMDAVEHGDSYVVTRDGRAIGELIPLRHPVRFVSRDRFLTAWAGAEIIDADRFIADIDAVIDNEWADPYES